MLLTEFDEKAYIEGVKQQSYADGELAGEVRGEARGRTEGEAKLAKLISKLIKDERTEDISKVTDRKELERLYKEYNM